MYMSFSLANHRKSALAFSGGLLLVFFGWKLLSDEKQKTASPQAKSVSAQRVSSAPKQGIEQATHRQASPTGAPKAARPLPSLPEVEEIRPIQVVVHEPAGDVHIEERLPSSLPLGIEQLFAIDPMIPERIQEGLVVENQHLLRPCFQAIVSDDQEEKVVSFDVVLDLRVDGEIGSIHSVGFSEPPNELSIENMECIQKSFQSISFDGLDLVFDGPIRYPIRTISRPKSPSKTP